MAPGRLGQAAFRVVFFAYAAGLVLWLAVGLLPVLVGDVPTIAAAVGRLAAGGGALAQPAAMLLQPTITVTGISGNTLLQYGFSLLNLVLGVLLIARRPTELVPRLLALGLLGTAATFNLPSHEAFHVLGSPWPIAAIHFTFHIVSGVAYLWAVVLFPDGRLPMNTAMPRRVLAASAGLMTAAVSFVCWWSDFLLHPQFFVIFFGIAIPVAGVGAQALRLADRGASPATRRSARLLVGALLPALAVGVIWCCVRFVALLPVLLAPVAAGAADRLQDLFPAVFAIVPVVLFAGVLRYRLFDIDRLLSRVLVYSLIVVATGLVYVLALVTGAALVRGANWWTVVVLAAASVGLEPAWSLVQRWANRVVFGRELSPESAMKTLIDGLEQVSATAEFDQLVEVSLRATRANCAQLWLLDVTNAAPGSFRLSASAPTSSAPDSAVKSPLLLPGRHWPVLYQGEQLGNLVISLDDAESLPPREQALLADLASHAGLLAHNALLADELTQRVDVLTERALHLSRSRRRLVAAQDRERRSIERDLHDGAQQTLVAVMLGLRMAGAADGPARLSMLRQLTRELTVSRVELAEISEGLLPTALRAGGLRAGLQGAAEIARRTGVVVELAVDLPAVLESGSDAAAAAVYYCCCEALQNISKYAAASRVAIEVHLQADEIAFIVTDNGVGFDRQSSPDSTGGISGLTDRAELSGGWIRVESSLGVGTRVRGGIPVATATSGKAAESAAAAGLGRSSAHRGGTDRPALKC